VNRLRSISLLLAVALLGALAALPLRACSVPVFRYALEHWEADPYRALVFHRGPLTPAQQALVRDLGPDGLAGRSHLNLAPQAIDLDQNPTPDVLEYWRQVGGTSLPWLVVRPPTETRLPGHTWSGPLTDTAVRTLVDSPARQEIARRLAHGQSAVWVMLDIGNPEKDDAAAAQVTERLRYLTGVLKLPKLDTQDIVNGLVSIGEKDLKLEFSFLRLARTNAQEQALVRMLLGTEADLADATEPILFPVFGRGRALYALVGKGINHQTIDEAAAFMIGSCSCETKELNPGVDLLLAADWEKTLKSQAAPPPVPDAADSAPVTVTISGGTKTAVAPAPAPTGRMISYIPLSAGIVIVAGILMLLVGRRK
jgi:hypothetical protein